jgi:2-oxoisovalerate dehydrogenase E1 component alpha subunit
VIRNPDNDGYRISKKKKFTVDTSNQIKPEAFYDDLFALREHLSLNYSWLNFDQNPLLKPATYPYPDTERTNTLIRAYTHMIRLRHMDTILQNIQRQGRISFYMTSHGEEATTIGAAAALDLDDVILAQYREAGALMWRGFTSQQFADQCFSNQGDLGKGRQMPVHYGSRALNYQTISSPLGTQLPQAVGAAYRLKLQKKANVSIVFFGDGCASSCDFHSACNFASTLNVPVIFLCRNNGYAISTPTTEQYAGDGIISRCRGYGMAGLRVDGNDLLAVCAAVQAAKEYALAHSSPVMIEAMTYRQGHHSTSDDSTRYRDHREVQTVTESMDPMVRLGAFLTNYGILDGDDSTRLSDSEKQKILQAIHIAETKGKPTLENLFEDVYKEKPIHLQRQEEQLKEHIQAVK